MNVSPTRRARVLPKALFFDVFGTVVDWRGSIVAEGMTWGKSSGLEVDWAHFADRWRAGYAPAMNKVRTGKIPWTRLDDLHRMLLESLLKEFRVAGLTEAEKRHWNLVWHRLLPWPDSATGLTRLKQKFTVATLSNGNVALLTDLAKNGHLPWDVILSAELFKHYKPDREVYLQAAAMLNLNPEETMMVAAHCDDLEAARGCGMQTGFIYRPLEFGSSRPADQATRGQFDIVSTGMLDLAAQLGA